MADNVIINEIEKYIAFLKNLSKDELASISKKETEIIFSIKEKGKQLKVSTSDLNDKDVEDIIDYLNSLSDRRNGEDYLKSVNLTRLDFEVILKKLDIPYLKKDPVSKLFDKIIESTIGYKLHSQAIQNNNLT